MRRLAFLLPVLSMTVVACTGSAPMPTVTPGSPAPTLRSAEVPWTLAAPQGWRASTVRTKPDPRLRVGVLESSITNVPYTFDFGSPGPNSGGGASRHLTTAGVVVIVQLYWFPPAEPIDWKPPDDGTAVGPPTVWHDDAQNPGWAFRERRVCLGSRCVRVLEWHGPDASGNAVEQGQSIAESVVLNANWADPSAR
jgi:hypothetical protein